jgi:hypothetical protein
VALAQGSGKLDKQTSLNGPIDKVNTILSTMTYICRSIDSCVPMSTDLLTVIINDLGFTGLGGDLSATSSIIISVH